MSLLITGFWATPIWSQSLSSHRGTEVLPIPSPVSSPINAAKGAQGTGEAEVDPHSAKGSPVSLSDWALGVGEAGLTAAIEQALTPRVRFQSLTDFADQVSDAGVSSALDRLSQLKTPLVATIAKSDIFEVASAVLSAERQAFTGAVDFVPRVGARLSTQGTGFAENFLAIEGFLPIAQNPGQALTFIEGRFLTQSKFALGGNALIGQRFFDSNSDRIYGAYVAYDYRNTGASSFNQIGVGLETLSNDLDLRINGYFPIGNTRNQIGTRGVILPGQLVLQRQFEAAATVVDAEVGRKLFDLADFGTLRGYVGTYYLSATGSSSVIGVKGRLELVPSNVFNLSLAVQNDALFNTRVTFGLVGSIPGTAPRGGEIPRESTLNRMAESVGRQPTIWVADSTIAGQTETVRTLLDSRLTTNGVVYSLAGLVIDFPLEVLGNSNSFLGGTFNGTVLVAGSGNLFQDSIFNNVVSVTGSNNTFTNTTFNSAFNLLGANTNLNGIVANGTTTISNTVNWGDNNRLGLVVATVPLTIAGDNNRITSLTATNLTLPASASGNVLTFTTGTTLDSLTLQGTNNTLNLAGVTTTNPLSIPAGATGNTLTGLTLNSPAGQGVTIAANNTTISGFTVNTPNGAGVFASNLNNITLTDNTINNSNGRGIELQNVTGQATATGNRINGTSGTENSGIVLENSAGNVNINFSNNQISNTTNNGIGLGISGTASATGVIANNITTGNPAFSGVFVRSSNTANVALTISDNVSNNNLNGILVQPLDNSTATFNILRNTTNGNTNSGIFAEAFNSSSLRVLLENNSATGNGSLGVGAGIFLRATNLSNLAASLRVNTITGNPGIADLRGETNLVISNPNLCLQLANNQIGNLSLNNQIGGILRLEGTLPGSNTIGTTTTGGVITGVPASTCGFP